MRRFALLFFFGWGSGWGKYTYILEVKNKLNQSKPIFCLECQCYSTKTKACTTGRGWSSPPEFDIHSLKLTVRTSQAATPKGNNHLPTIHFQVRFVSCREDNPSKKDASWKMLNFSSKRSYVFSIELLNPSRTRAVSKYEVPTLFCPKKSFAKWNSWVSPKKLDIQVVPPCRCSPWNTPTVSVSSLTEELQQLEISGISSGQGPVRGKRLGYSKPMPPYNFRISRWRSCGEAAALLPVFFGNQNVGEEIFCVRPMWKFQGCQLKEKKLSSDAAVMVNVTQDIQIRSRNWHSFSPECSGSYWFTICCAPHLVSVNLTLINTSVNPVPTDTCCPSTVWDKTYCWWKKSCTTSDI